jgi:AcrR family transcriptional regulator
MISKTRRRPTSPRGQARRPSGRLSRADKSAATRRKLISAATQIVGLEGYANASVSKITARARVAQGTFYNYFDSQQDLFNHLLPELGQQLLDYIGKRLAGCKESLTREEIGFQAFFDFLSQTPEFYRVLNEAEMFSPTAFRDHMDNMTKGYVRSLRRSQQKGELKGFSDKELEVLVCILLSARNYISYHFIYRDHTNDHLPPWVVQAYMKFIIGGVNFGLSNPQLSRRQRSHALHGGKVETLAPPKIETVRANASAALLKMRLSDAYLGSNGAIKHPILFELMEAAAAPVAGTGAMRAPKLINLTVSLLVPTRASLLVASSHCDSRGDGVALVSVQIAEGERGGKAVATGQLLFASPPDNGHR